MAAAATWAKYLRDRIRESDRVARTASVMAIRTCTSAMPVAPRIVKTNAARAMRYRSIFSCVSAWRAQSPARCHIHQFSEGRAGPVN